MYLGKGFDSYLKENKEVGFVESLKEPMVGINGLPGAFLGEVVIFENGSTGIIFSLEGLLCEVLALEKYNFSIGDRVARTGKTLSVPIGEDFLGGAYTCLGKRLTGKLERIHKSERFPIFKTPPDFPERAPINEPLLTGVSKVDLMVPLGKGQRELVLGNRKSGKTEFLLQAIMAQIEEGSVCIYVSVGKNRSDILDVLDFAQQPSVKDSMVVVASSASDLPGDIYLTPYVGMTMAEYFKDKGRDVLLILDDLSIHAKFYRELSLVSGSFPGRNSYPGDIFFIHSQLLERAGNFKVGENSKAITCLAVAETTEGDISGYIQTNLMSMTDGHLFFDEELFNAGSRPAVNTFLSVTRVGKQVQSRLHHSLHRELLGFLNLLKKHRQFIHFGAEISEGVKTSLETGERLDKFFNQEPRFIYPLNVQYVLFTMIWGGFVTKGQVNTLKFLSKRMSDHYRDKTDFREYIDGIVQEDMSFNDLLSKVAQEKDNIINFLGIDKNE